jgi:hypothetical protein
MTISSASLIIKILRAFRENAVNSSQATHPFGICTHIQEGVLDKTLAFLSLANKEQGSNMPEMTSA